MTIPNLQLPNTRPGPNTMVPGAGDAVAGGLNAVLMALLQKAKLNQGQQGLDLEAQRNAATAQYEQGMVANEQARQANLRDQQNRTLAQQQAVGTALAQLAQPEVNANLPNPQMPGGVIPVSVPRATLAHVLKGADPATAAAILKEAAPLLKQRETDDATKKENLARQTYLSSLPTDLRKIETMRFSLQDSGVKDDPLITSMLADTYAKGASPATLKMLDAKYPGLGHAEQMALYLKEQEARITAKYREGPTPQLIFAADGSGRAAWVKPGDPLPFDGQVAKTAGGTEGKQTVFVQRAKLVWPAMQAAKKSYDADYANGGDLSLGEVQAISAIFDNPKNIRGKTINWAVGSGISDRAKRMGNAAYQAARAQVEMMGRGGAPEAIAQQAKDYLLGKQYFDAGFEGMRTTIAGPKGASPRADLNRP